MKLLFKYFSIHIKSIMQYKVSFFLTLVGQFLVSFSVFVGVYFLFSRFKNVAGFTYNEVLLCFSIVLMSFSISESLFRGFDRFPPMIQNGEFDRIMTRPRNEILQILGMKIDLSRTGRMLQAIVILVYAIPVCGVVWSFDKISIMILMIVGGIFFFSGLFMIYAGISFFTIQGLEFMNILTDGGREFGTYPLSIYGNSYLKFFTYIIPMACFQYYPFLYLVNRTSNILYGFLPGVSVLFIIPCYSIWRYGAKRYKSTGS